MKGIITISAMLLLLITGCTGNKQSTDDLITVDVTAKYPHKELILQDFMDLEYIPLETKDDFICQGLLQDVGKNLLIIRNFGNDGNIYLFDRQGKALRIINRKGQGNEEYAIALNVTLDEEKGEIFVNDMYTKKIVVYDLEGNFKRTFHHKEGLMYIKVYNFDQENLLCHDGINDNNISAPNAGQSFMIVSKQDGSITKEIQIPFEKRKSIVISKRDEAKNMNYSWMPSTIHPIMPYFNDYILVELSADTLYRYSPDHSMEPFMVRTPSIQSMNPEKFLLLSLLTDRYYFMESIEKTMDFTATNLVYDKQEKALFKYTVYNGDFTNPEEAFLKSPPVNREIPSRQYLEAYKLVQAYNGGRLKGRLKEIAANLDEESNPVIMLIKHKK